MVILNGLEEGFRPTWTDESNLSCSGRQTGIIYYIGRLQWENLFHFYTFNSRRIKIHKTMVGTNINKNHKGHVLNKLAKTVLNMETESLFTKAYFFKIKETITDIV